MDRDTRALTGIRGIAAVWVMIGHFTGGLDGMPLAQLASKSYLAVDLFFVLSGFVLALNHGTAFVAGEPSDLCFAFYRRRIARVYPLYLVVVLLTLALGSALPTPIRLLANLTMTHVWFLQDGIVPPSWSVSVEAFAYLAFPWIAAFVFRRSSASALCVILAVWSCLWWMTTLDPARSFGELDPGGPLDIRRGSVFPILRGVCGFVAGVCAYRLSCLPRVRSAMATRGLAEALLVAIVLLVWQTQLDLVVAILFVPLVCALAGPGHPASCALGSRLAMRLGDLSYALYLSHLLVGTLVRDALVGTMPNGLVLVSCGLAALAASAILHALVERPCHAVLRHARLSPLRGPSPATA